MPMIPPSTVDNLDQIAAVKASPLYEMLFSLEALSMPRCSDEIVEGVERKLGSDFRGEVRELYSPLNHGMILAEFALAWDNHEDIPGFLDWVESLGDREFAWYVLGRVPLLEDIPESINEKTISDLIDTQIGHFGNHWYIENSWAGDFSRFRSRILDIWRRYWETVFSIEVSGFRARWAEGVKQAEDNLEQRGALRSYFTTCEKSELPPSVPENMPYREFLFIPSCRSSHARAITFFGYGRIHVIFNCRIQQEDREQFRAKREALLTSFKSLSDETRLRVLRQIALNERVANGKWLAAKLKVSPSVISRHIGQLKSAGLIEEHTEDNRNFTYTLNADTIRGLSEDLERYVLSSS